MPEINFTQFFDITEVDTQDYGEAGFTSLSPDEFGIAAPENMNMEPDTLSCQDVINQWCSLNTESCVTGGSGRVSIAFEHQQEFNESYPNCSGLASTSNLNQNNTTMNKKDIWNIQSPDFLGGPNVHSLIIIVLAVLILGSNTRGNIFKGIATAAKDTVK
tara:strand:+ start:270 stop:749 length:480 start_codon:yes stop_codon:yes gene_type:complete